MGEVGVIRGGTGAREKKHQAGFLMAFSDIGSGVFLSFPRRC